MDIGATTGVPGCAFCARGRLDLVLEETAHFFLLADHAPLVAGHVLIVPRAHYACYGAIPAALEDEFLALKRRVTDFLVTAYGVPAFFEHGVFHQSVYHAHLHALPFGPVAIDVHQLATGGGQPMRAPADVRAWYAAHGPYFYLEQPAAAEAPAAAAIFAPREDLYFRVLGALRRASIHAASWQPQPLRRMTGRSQVEALVAAWRRFAS